MESIEKTLPHDDLMERTVLGAILSSHPQASELLDALKPDDFFNSWHRKIAGSVLTLFSAGTFPDLLAVHDDLTRNGDIEAAGGIAYVASICGGIADKSDVLYVLRGLRRMAAFRQAVHLAEHIKQLAVEQAGNVESLLDSAIEKFSTLARDLESTEDDGAPYFDSAIEALSGIREGARLKIYTDVDKLDQWTGGFRDGELVVLTAETGAGKSLFAAQIRTRACRDQYLALFCSGEMTRAHLASRELATASGVTPIKLRRDDLLTEEDFRDLTEAASHQCKKCRILDGELSLSRIRRAARKMKSRAGLDLLILDYDELIEAEGKTEFEQQRVIARAAKSMALELKCCVILISQLRKTTQGEDAGKPTLQRLYGSAAKQKFASFIILADRPYVRELQGDEKEAELQLLKSRDGKTGRIKATFNIKSLRFEEAKEDLDAEMWRTPAEPRERD
ncbi:MAG TPA: replicative DNA helicase [Candidatus Acidoferrales bacterium]|jgi:replicative DNA helicase|nr:replicative DNA helicase [Candidatus Acidoferrales bacterium]